MNRNFSTSSFVMVAAVRDSTSSSIVNRLVQNMFDGAGQVYYDTLTGEKISQAKYIGNVLCDHIKVLSPYVYTVSIGIGLLLLIMIQNSGKIKKIAISGFIVGVPMIWYGMAYFLVAFMADYLIK